MSNAELSALKCLASDASIVVRYENMIADPNAVLHQVAGLVGLSVGDGPRPDLIDDRDVAKPYKELMGAFLAGGGAGVEREYFRFGLEQR